MIGMFMPVNTELVEKKRSFLSILANKLTCITGRQSILSLSWIAFTLSSVILRGSDIT